jgi:hypothetical protein
MPYRVLDIRFVERDPYACPPDFNVNGSPDLNGMVTGNLLSPSTPVSSCCTE